jgi:hypothetical protein
LNLRFSFLFGHPGLTTETPGFAFLANPLSRADIHRMSGKNIRLRPLTPKPNIPGRMFD